MAAGVIKLDPGMMAFLSKGTGVGGLLPYSREIFVLNDYVAGTSYCENISEIATQLKIDSPLKLRRVPDNEVDDFAIGVYYEDVRVGWVPMKDNLVIARLMDAGKLFTCKVVKIKNQGGHVGINVSIFMVD